MSVDLIDVILSVTDDPEMLVKIILPHLRGVSYYANKSVNEKFEFDNECILKLMELIPNEKLFDLALNIKSLNLCIRSQNNISLECNCSELIKHYIFSTDKSERMLDATDITSVGNILKNIFVYNQDTRYENLINNHALISYFIFTTGLLFSLAEKLCGSINEYEIVMFSLIFLCARMEYEQRNLTETDWIPLISDYLSCNFGRFFRVREIEYLDKKIPLYKVLSDYFEMQQPTNIQWSDSISHNVRKFELNSYVALNHIFTFLVADNFIKIHANKDSYFDIICQEKQCPCVKTLNRFFNLFLMHDLYDTGVAVDEWKPPRMIKDYLLTEDMAYNEKEFALRQEYFPLNITDVDSLLYFAKEFYNEKFQIDLEYGNVSSPNEIDDVSIWYLTEWILQNRHYDFLNSYDVWLLSSMISNAIRI